MKQEELDKLLDQMSLEEKINQLSQISGSFYLDNSEVTGPMHDQRFTEKNIKLAGSVIGTYGADKVKRIQREYIEQHPNHIPLIFMLDIINGFKTVFPIPLGQGATFEPELVEKCAQVAAKEASVSGVHVTFSPMVDLVRDARWGRVMESTGEDPYLNCCFAKAMVRGYQGDNLNDEYHIAACIKHFAGYGAPIAGRDYNTVELSEHTLREYYFPAYQAGIDAGAALVMSSFNTINGVPATGNKWLMVDVLRKEMNFEGVLISDWTAIEELVYHGYCENFQEAAFRSMESAVDIDMMSGIYVQNLQSMIDDGKISKSMVDDATMRVLQLKNKLGLFENPVKDADEEKETKYHLCKEHRALAKKTAEKSFVLLKNEENILPIDETKKIAFIGPYTDNRNILGAWSFTGDPQDTISIKSAAEEVFSSENTVYLQGCPLVDETIKMEGFGGREEQKVSKESQKKMMEEALYEAEKADIVIMPLGEHYLQSGEATSRGNIQIPEIQQNLFEKVWEVNHNIIVILFTGRPLDLRKIEQKAKAILCVWMPGTEGGHAIIDVVRGKFNPEGKLPMSFPFCVGQVPIAYNEFSTGRPHIQGKDKDRFRSKYLDIPNQPLFPFGYGLSYTNFSISEIQLSSQTLTPDKKLKATVYLKNEGKKIGTEVVQLYLQDVAASVVRPVKELKAFKKVTLAPGECIQIIFEITVNDLMFVNQKGLYISESGVFKIYIGSDSRTENQKEFVFTK